MTGFVDKVRKYMAARLPQVAQCDGIVVGISGGADSVALAAVLTALNYRCVGVHCHYGLRGAESDRDCDVAARVADLLGIKLIIKRFEVSGSAIEEKCRQLRYELFEQVSQEYGCRLIAVGHHLEDNIETFLFNALRGGASLRSLKAMTPMRDNIIRPLLACTRAEIEHYLTQRRLPWITDSSNLGDDYARNRIRHHLLPAMRQVKADADRCMASTIDTLQSNYTLLTEMVNMARSRYISDGKTDVALMCHECACPALLLFEMFDRTLSMTQTENIVNAVGCKGARRFGDMILEGGILSPAPTQCESVEFNIFDGIAGVIESAVVTRDKFAPMRDADTLWLDADTLSDSQYATLRPWRGGDRLSPFGMKGSRLVSDIFSDAHAGAAVRNEPRILEYDNHILWVIGFRTSRHHAVTSSTRRILRLRFIR